MWSQWSLFSPRQFGPSTCELWQQKLSTDSWLIDGFWFLALVAEPRTSKRLLRCNYDTTPPLNTYPVDTYCVDSGCTWSVEHRERIMLSYFDRTLGGTGQKLKSICKFWGTEHTKYEQIWPQRASYGLLLFYSFFLWDRSWSCKLRDPWSWSPTPRTLAVIYTLEWRAPTSIKTDTTPQCYPSLGTPKVTTIQFLEKSSSQKGRHSCALEISNHFHKFGPANFLHTDERHAPTRQHLSMSADRIIPCRAWKHRGKIWRTPTRANFCTSPI